jgi:hypothetical protein
MGAAALAVSETRRRTLSDPRCILARRAAHEHDAAAVVRLVERGRELAAAA